LREDWALVVAPSLPCSAPVQHLYDPARQRNVAGCAGLGHRLTVQFGYEDLTRGGIAAGLDQGGVDAYARDVGMPVEVGPP